MLQETINAGILEADENSSSSAKNQRREASRGVAYSSGSGESSASFEDTIQEGSRNLPAGDKISRKKVAPVEFNQLEKACRDRRSEEVVVIARYPEGPGEPIFHIVFESRERNFKLVVKKYKVELSKLDEAMREEQRRFNSKRIFKVFFRKTHQKQLEKLRSEKKARENAIKLASVAHKSSTELDVKLEKVLNISGLGQSVTGKKIKLGDLLTDSKKSWNARNRT